MVTPSVTMGIEQETLLPNDPHLSDEDILATIARFQVESAMVEVTDKENKTKSGIVVETIGDPETDPRAAYLITFPADKETLDAIIAVYENLANQRKAAGFTTFIVAQFPYGETSLANLATMYFKAHPHFSGLQVISAVDLSQISGPAITAVTASLYIIRDFFHTNVQICKSRAEAIEWLQHQQGKSST